MATGISMVVLGTILLIFPHAALWLERGYSNVLRSALSRIPRFPSAYRRATSGPIDLLRARAIGLVFVVIGAAFPFI